MGEPLFVTKKFSGPAIIFISLMVLFIGGGFYGSVNAVGSGTFASDSLFVLGLFTACLVVAKINVYKVYADKVEIYSILGFLKRKVLLNDILEWRENYQVGSRGSNYTTLLLYTPNEKIRINSGYLGDENYANLKLWLTKDKHYRNHD